MKTTLKLSTLLVALASVFTFSSCLNDSDDSTNPAYHSYITITGDKILGYRFYADNGAILVPTTASVEQVLPGLSGSNVKRAFVSFDVINVPADGFLKPGEIYQIVLAESYYSNYAIPTYNTLYSFEPTDSLHTDNQPINNVNNNIWAANGYLNAQMTLNYQRDKMFYLNTFYSEKDIDVENNTFNLNIYYNSKSSNPYDQGTSVFSFRLPEDASFNFQTDSINLILNAITNYGNKQLTKVGECKVAIKDFYAPMY